VRLAPGSRSRLEWHWMQDGAAQASQIEPGTNAFERTMIRLLRWVPGLEAQI
jgi:hypothetical protein